MRVSLEKIKNLNKIKELYPQKWEKAVIKFPWLKTNKPPTLKQLQNTANFFNIPLGYFFIESIPIPKIPIPHYRTFNKEIFTPSEELLDTIKDLLKKQEWIKEILIEWGYEKLEYAGKYTINTDYKIIVKEAKKILKIKNNWISSITSWSQSFKFLTTQIEKAGIFVVINGVVGNNNYRKLNVNEFRGFVLYDKIAPFIFINNNDSFSGKIFTIIHEFFHILIGKSASFDLRSLQPANNDIEKFCDLCTAEFLVPEDELKIKYKQDRNIKTLSNYFKVSPIVIARRLLDLNYLTKEEFFEFYNKYLKEDFNLNKKSSGGDFYNNLQNRIGKRFLELIIIAQKNNIISFIDFYKLLNLKRNTAEKVFKKFERI